MWYVLILLTANLGGWSYWNYWFSQFSLSFIFRHIFPHIISGHLYWKENGDIIRFSKICSSFVCCFGFINIFSYFLWPNSTRCFFFYNFSLYFLENFSTWQVFELWNLLDIWKYIITYSRLWTRSDICIYICNLLPSLTHMRWVLDWC